MCLLELATLLLVGPPDDVGGLQTHERITYSHDNLYSPPLTAALATVKEHRHLLTHTFSGGICHDPRVGRVRLLCDVCWVEINARSHLKVPHEKMFPGVSSTLNTYYTN